MEQAIQSILDAFLAKQKCKITDFEQVLDNSKIQVCLSYLLNHKKVTYDETTDVYSVDVQLFEQMLQTNLISQYQYTRDVLIHIAKQKEFGIYQPNLTNYFTKSINNKDVSRSVQILKDNGIIFQTKVKRLFLKRFVKCSEEIIEIVSFYLYRYKIEPKSAQEFKTICSQITQIQNIVYNFFQNNEKSKTIGKNDQYAMDEIISMIQKQMQSDDIKKDQIKLIVTAFTTYDGYLQISNGKLFINKSHQSNQLNEQIMGLTYQKYQPQNEVFIQHCYINKSQQLLHRAYSHQIIVVQQLFFQVQNKFIENINQQFISQFKNLIIQNKLTNKQNSYEYKENIVALTEAVGQLKHLFQEEHKIKFGLENIKYKQKIQQQYDISQEPTTNDVIRMQTDTNEYEITFKDKIDVLVENEKDQKIQIKMKIVRIILNNQPLFTFSMLFDFMQMQLLQMGNFQLLNNDIVMNVVEKFIDNKILQCENVIKDSRIFNRILSLANVDMQSDQYKQIKSQALQVDERGENVDDEEYDDSTEYQNKYYIKDKKMRSIHLYQRIISIVIQNKKFEAMYKPCTFGVDNLITQLTVKDILKQLHFFKYLFKSDMLILLEQNYMDTSFCDLPVYVLQNIFGGKKNFQQIKQYITQMLKYLSQFNLLFDLQLVDIVHYQVIPTLRIHQQKMLAFQINDKIKIDLTDYMFTNCIQRNNIRITQNIIQLFDCPFIKFNIEINQFTLEYQLDFDEHFEIAHYIFYLLSLDIYHRLCLFQKYVCNEFEISQQLQMKGKYAIDDFIDKYYKFKSDHYCNNFQITDELKIKYSLANIENFQKLQLFFDQDLIEKRNMIIQLKYKNDSQKLLKVHLKELINVIKTFCYHFENLNDNIQQQYVYNIEFIQKQLSFQIYDEQNLIAIIFKLIESQAISPFRISYKGQYQDFYQPLFNQFQSVQEAISSLINQQQDNIDEHETCYKQKNSQISNKCNTVPKKINKEQNKQTQILQQYIKQNYAAFEQAQANLIEFKQDMIDFIQKRYTQKEENTWMQQLINIEVQFLLGFINIDPNTNLFKYYDQIYIKCNKTSINLIQMYLQIKKLYFTGSHLHILSYQLGIDLCQLQEACRTKLNNFIQINLEKILNKQFSKLDNDLMLLQQINRKKQYNIKQIKLMKHKSKQRKTYFCQSIGTLESKRIKISFETFNMKPNMENEFYYNSQQNIFYEQLSSGIDPIVEDNQYIKLLTFMGVFQELNIQSLKSNVCQQLKQSFINFMQQLTTKPSQIFLYNTQKTKIQVNEIFNDSFMETNNLWKQFIQQVDLNQNDNDKLCQISAKQLMLVEENSQLSTLTHNQNNSYNDTNNYLQYEKSQQSQFSSRSMGFYLKKGPLDTKVIDEQQISDQQSNNLDQNVADLNNFPQLIMNSKDVDNQSISNMAMQQNQQNQNQYKSIKLLFKLGQLTKVAVNNVLTYIRKQEGYSEYEGVFLLHNELDIFLLLNKYIKEKVFNGFYKSMLIDSIYNNHIIFQIIGKGQLMRILQVMQYDGEVYFRDQYSVLQEQLLGDANGWVVFSIM